MSLIIKEISITTEISIWSNNKGYWLVITDGGSWIYWDEINYSMVEELIVAGIDYNVDKEMKSPDPMEK